MSMQTIAITGASGFIGKNLVSELIRMGGYEIRVLSRNRLRDLREGRFDQDIGIFEGDLSAPESLKDFLVQDCIVINLVYLWNAGEASNLECTNNLLAACNDAKVARLVHFSTAAVAGRAFGNLINEKTPCLPITEYGKTKLRIEKSIVDFKKNDFDAVILRPTSVFGVGGDPLKKLSNELIGGPRYKSYLKSCLFGRRRMNLVHVTNVVAAAIFLIEYADRLDDEIFIVSNDDDPKNNFIDVERLLMDGFGVKKFFLPRIPLPLIWLKWLLIALRRNSVNPCCSFDSSKLSKLGFNSPIGLCEGLAQYIDWYHTFYICEKGVKVK